MQGIRRRFGVQDMTTGRPLVNLVAFATPLLIGNLAQDIHFPLQYVVTRQISLFGSCASAGEYPQCLALIASGDVEVDSMISKKVPLAEGDLWMNKIYRREDGLAKLVFLCDEDQA